MSKTIVITAGGTSEPIDNVRTITNMSTGKLGVTICDTLLSEIPQEIETVYYMCSSLSLRPPENEKIKVIIVKGTYDLKAKVENLLNKVKVDFFIHCMAVSYYTTDYVSSVERMTNELVDKFLNVKGNITKDKLSKLIYETIECPDNKISRDKKMSSSERGIFVKLKQTPKVISIIKGIQPELTLIGFKLLSDVSKDELIRVASNLLKNNNCDYVVANDLVDIKMGKHNAIIISKYGEVTNVTGKDIIAYKITNIVKG